MERDRDVKFDCDLRGEAMKKEYEPHIVGSTDVLGGAFMMVSSFGFLCALSFSSQDIIFSQIFVLTESLHYAPEYRSVEILGEIILLKALYIVSIIYGLFVMVRAACKIYAGLNRIFADSFSRTNIT